MAGNERQERRQRRSYTAEFKASAVKLVLEEGRPLAQVARDLDLTQTAFRKWVEQAKADHGTGKAGALTTEERAELSSLRKRVRELEMERAILKNAAAFFAKEMK